MDWDEDGLEAHEREDYFDRAADAADALRDRMMLDGTWWLWRGSGLPLAEWQRQQAEERAGVPNDA